MHNKFVDFLDTYPYLGIRRKCVIIVDLDGTVCNHDHRAHFAEEKDWDAYHAKLIGDTVNHHIVSILEAMSASHYYILACTGRPEKYRLKTIEWLATNQVPIDDILMRPNNNFDSDANLKIELVSEYFDGFGEEYVNFVLDDRDSVVEAWRDNNFKCLQVQEGNF